MSLATANALAARIPPPVRELLARLAEAGHEAVLVGGCVRDLAAGRAVRDFDVATSAQPEEVLALFPRAIPIGLQHGTVMVPTTSGPVDVTRFRGPDLTADLARRDFTLNALAIDPRHAGLLDPHGGLADLSAARLRAVGSAEARLAEDPLRALRAARFVATLGVTAEPELERALPGAGTGLAGVAGERLRAELDALLLGPQVEAGLRLLQRSGLDEVIAPGIGADAPERVAALPPDLGLRLAAWLRGTRVASALARLRPGRARRERVLRLLQHHPVERAVAPRSHAAVRRLLARVGRADVDALIALRETELELAASSAAESDASRARLDTLRTTLAQLDAAGALALAREHLALDGADVMRELDCGPGPTVGRALHHLTECVLDDPEANRPERLRELLRSWDGRPSSAAPDVQDPTH